MVSFSPCASQASKFSDLSEVVIIEIPGSGTNTAIARGNKEVPVNPLAQPI